MLRPFTSRGCGPHPGFARRRSAFGLSFALVTAFAVPGGVAYAAPEGRIELDAELPAPLRGCISASKLEQSYRRALAADGGESAERPFELRVRVSAAAGPSADTTLIELVAADAGRPLGSRELPVRARDCAALPDALALVLVLLSRSAEPVAPAPLAEPAAAAPLPAAPEESELPPVLQPTPHSSSTGGSVALGGGAGVAMGALPRAALVLQLMAATSTEPIAARLRVGFLWPQELGVAEGTVYSHAYELAAELCAAARFEGRPRAALRMCLGPQLGLVAARGENFEVKDREREEFVLNLGLMPGASLWLGESTSLELITGLSIALVRPSFRVEFQSGARPWELSGPGALRADLSLSLVQIF